MDKRTSSQFIPSNEEYRAEGTPFGPAVGPAERRRRKKESKKITKDIKKSGGFPEEK